jgi:hypothetical protein
VRMKRASAARDRSSRVMDIGCGLKLLQGQGQVQDMRGQ